MGQGGASEMKMILASGSPRRKELLGRLNIPFDIIKPDLNEELLPDENPTAHCYRLAAEKSETVAQHHADALVIGSDTIVILNEEIMGKPNDLMEARQMLRRLSGKTHVVKTAVSIQCRSLNICSTFVESTTVTFHPLADSDIEHYLDIAPPLDKAGAYGIQDWSGVFVDKVEGCYHNVVGFPLAAFYQRLKSLNLLDKIGR